MNCAKIIAIAIFMAGGAQAHDGHDHDELPVSKIAAERVADKALLALVSNKEVGAGWQVKHRASTQPYKAGQATIWMTTYKKPAADGKREEQLHIFVDTFGNYIDANQTGKL